MQFDELWRELCRELCRDACEDWSPMTPGWPPPLPCGCSSRQLRVEHLDLQNEFFCELFSLSEANPWLALISSFTTCSCLVLCLSDEFQGIASHEPFYGISKKWADFKMARTCSIELKCIMTRLHFYKFCPHFKTFLRTNVPTSSRLSKKFLKKILSKVLHRRNDARYVEILLIGERRNFCFADIVSETDQLTSCYGMTQLLIILLPRRWGPCGGPPFHLPDGARVGERPLAHLLDPCQPYPIPRSL